MLSTCFKVALKVWPLIFSFSTCRISSEFWSLHTDDHCWAAMEKPVKYSWGHVFIWVTCSSGYHSLAGLHSTRARTAPCSGAPCYGAGENSRWAEVPKDKSNTSMQRLLSQSSSNTVPHYGLKCMSPQNSREIQCPEMKYKLSCKCFLSASHHNNKMSQIFRSHWSVYIIYTKGCPQQHWELPARQGKGRRWTRSESYERKLKEIRSPEMCGHKLWVGSRGTWCGGAAGFEQWPDPALSHCCWAQTTQQHDVLWSHDRALQTPLAFWTSNWGSPGPLGLDHSLH